MNNELVGRAAGTLWQLCVSHHLRVLADSGLVTSQKVGRCVQVQLNRAPMRKLAGILGQLD